MALDKKYLPTAAKAFRTRPNGVAVESPIHCLEVDLTAAQLIAMGTTPVSIIPTPAANKTIVIDSIVFQMTRTATPFTGGGALNFQYHTTTTSVPHAGTVPASVLTTAGAAVTQTLLGPNVGASGLVVPQGEGIDLTNTGGAFAAGTGTAKVFIFYNVLYTA